MQKLRFSKYFQVLIIAIDLVLMMVAFWFLFESKYHIGTQFSWQFWEQFGFRGLFFSAIWLLLNGYTKLYHIPRSLTYTLFLRRVFVHTFLFVIILYLLGKITESPLMQSRKGYLATLFSLMFIVSKSLVFFLLKYIRRFGINHRNVMFLGEHKAMLILENTLRKRKDYGYKIYPYEEQDFRIEQITKFWKEQGIHTVFLPLKEEKITEELREQIFAEAVNMRVNISLVPEVDSTDFFKFDISYIETLPILTASKFPLEYYANFMIKRGVDIMVSLLVLLCIGIWLFPIIALLIVLDSKGPVFFLQKRYGKYDEVFSCIKFRTMVVNPLSSVSTTCENDSRITAVGRFLRQTSLDELPQFVNVLLGQMSVVGPRPHMLKVDDYYRTQILRYGFRSTVLPGITGLAQVSGLRGDKGDMKIEMKKRILADSFYIKNWSLTLDFVIILKTVFILFKGDKNAR